MSRKRNLDDVKQRDEEADEDKKREFTAKSVRQTTSVPFPKETAVTIWLGLFQAESDRYPFLVVLGPSRSWKAEFAKSLFKAPLDLKVGGREHFPDGMRVL